MVFCLNCNELKVVLLLKYESRAMHLSNRTLLYKQFDTSQG